MELNKRKFVICIDNTYFPASLTKYKKYELIPDSKAEEERMVRVIDNSGEDYLFSMNHFILLEALE
jgi:hypothetical protein